MYRKLNQKQTDLLTITFRFRYLTTNNLALHRNISQNSAYSSLQTLYKAGYLGRRHKKSYRLLNKPASYYLTTEAVKYLKQADLDIDKTVLESRYREKVKSAEFIDLQIAIHRAYMDLKRNISNKGLVQTGTDISGHEGMMRPLPSLYVNPKDNKHYFVELTDHQHLFIVRKRIRKYIQNYENNEWDWDTYPDVYIVRESVADRRRLLEYAEEQMDDNYLDEDDFSFHIVNGGFSCKQ